MDSINTVLTWLKSADHRRRAAAILLIVAVIAVTFAAVRSFGAAANVLMDARSDGFRQWGGGDPGVRRALITRADGEVCPEAPFLLPTDGWIGLLYGDPRPPYNDSRRHQGIDIFSDGEPGTVPVYAAYDGYVTRLPGWISSLIIRVPDDPLNPGRQIWLYYAHMASKDGTRSFIADAFPQGTEEAFVTQGTLLGATGEYSGTAGGIWTHLHFSIVLDDGAGQFRNELEFNNTVDPSRYLGMAVNYGCAPLAPACTLRPTCDDAVLGTGGL